ncbi:hypothetical protein BGZ99_010466 [Dissophora globulifera]|uniref:Uncharacterized protein n=1 Tax=Dissophora globulifera TaxID=979702 RepID=A0A9P6R5U6_9FUNG|nr:hypothetical protein BGZ99_010466 [Dissophora globulifera]
MSTPNRPTWLNQLPDHSIFELDEQEYLEWTRTNHPSTTTAATTRTPHASSLAKYQFNSGHKESFGLEELKEEYQRASQGLSCMVIYGQDMYVAVGRQVRHTSLADLKKGVENHGRAAATEYIDKKHHKVLKIQDIDFDIRRLVINQDGKLLAIVGDEKIVIAALPKALRQDPKAVNCKAFPLGEYYHINKGPSKIVKVLWHPLSKGFTHVLVMTHDNLLRMYDVATDFEEPEQVFNFAPEGHTANSYGLDVDYAASFCFGSKHSEWGQLTVYNLSQSGDVFMMCPVMPGNCILDIPHLEAIRADLDQQTKQAGGSQRLQQVKREWLESVLESAQPHPFSDEVVMVENPLLKHVKVARQGPFLFQPAPIELEDDDNRAYDILSLETEAAEVLAMAYSSGRVDVCIAVERPSARWTVQQVRKKDSGSYGFDDTVEDEDEDDDYFPTISVYESIDLGLLRVFGTTNSTQGGGYGMAEQRLGIPNHPVLAADAMYGDTFYVYHEAGAHCISIVPWLEELTKIYDAASRGVVAGLDARVATFYNSKVKSSVSCIVNTRPTKASMAAPIVGCSVVTDTYLEYSLLLLTSSLQLIGQELTTRPRKMTVEDSTLTSQQSPTVVKKEDAHYQNSLPLPLFGSQDGLAALSRAPIQPKIVLPPGVGSAKIIVTEDNLRFLGEMVQGIRESLREVYIACDIAQQRLVAQEQEYKRQQQKVADAHERNKTVVAKKMQEQADRVDAQAVRQKKLMSRVDELMRKLMESKEPELSPAEKAWVVDVVKSEKRVKGYNERRHKVNTQYNILHRRLQELQGLTLSSSSSGASKRPGQSSAGNSEEGTSLSSSPGWQSVVQYQQQRHAARRYGTAQIATVESALGVEAQLLDTTMKMVAELASRLDVLDISSNATE